MMGSTEKLSYQTKSWFQVLFFGFYAYIYMTASQLNPSFECGEGMKVKVVKWCWKKWNWPILMHIYDKQCEIMQKNQWKSPNIQIQCFYNGTVLKTPKKTQKLEKLKRKLLKILHYRTVWCGHISVEFLRVYQIIMYCVIHILKFLSRWMIIKNTKSS